MFLYVFLTYILKTRHRFLTYDYKNVHNKVLFSYLLYNTNPMHHLAT